MRSKGTLGITAIFTILVLAGSGFAYAVSPAPLSLSVTGVVLNAGNQSYTVKGGQVVYASINGQMIDPSSAQLEYAMWANVNNIHVSGNARIRFSGTVAGTNTNVTLDGNVNIKDMVDPTYLPLGCSLSLGPPSPPGPKGGPSQQTCNSAIPAFFQGQADLHMTITSSAVSATSTLLTCDQANLHEGQKTNCHATVSSADGTMPTGTVAFSSTGGGTLSHENCNSPPSGKAPPKKGVLKCDVQYAPGASPIQSVLATYPGDSSHLTSSDGFVIFVGTTNQPSSDTTTSIQFESPYLNPFGTIHHPIIIASTDGAIVIVTTYTVGTIQWDNTKLGGVMTGTFGSVAVSGDFNLTSHEDENLVTGTAIDHGQIFFTQMSPAFLNAKGTYNGTSVIPRAGAIDCSYLTGFPDTCFMTGLNSVGQFTMQNKPAPAPGQGPPQRYSITGTYSTTWGIPAIGFSSSVTAVATSQH